MEFTHSAPADEHRLYLRGIACFNAGDFFMAHELWEEIWRSLPDPPDAKKHFYQGLIQIAVTLEHLRRGNLRGVHRLRARYTHHLSFLPDFCRGLDLAALQQAMTDLLNTWWNADQPTPGPFCLNPHAAPRLSLSGQCSTSSEHPCK